MMERALRGTLLVLIIANLILAAFHSLNDEYARATFFVALAILLTVSNRG